jgi:ribose transport system permease protein
MRRAFHFQEVGLVVVIVIISALLALLGGTVPSAGGATANKFLRPDNLLLLAKNTSFFAVMAAGMALVIITGGIDLSVGSIYALAGVCGAMVLQRHGPLGARPDVGPALAVGAGIVACVGVGALCGLVNGLLITILRVHPFIITLGTMAAFRGIAFVCPSWFSEGGAIAIGQSIGDFPESFTDHFIRLDLNRLLGVAGDSGLYPVPMLVMLAATAATAFVLAKTVFGRRLFAIGSNELAARYCGVPVERTKVLVYTLSGASCGVAAAIMLGYYGSASSDNGNGYELTVIASAVVGGASLSGGRGSALGALLGALILQLIDNAIIILSINQNYSKIIIGAVIVVAVVLDRLNERMLRGMERAAPHTDFEKFDKHESEVAG